jgi:hypothetical protein
MQQKQTIALPNLPDMSQTSYVGAAPQARHHWYVAINDVEVGPGGKQIQVEDPDGNPIELHEAPRG